MNLIKQQLKTYAIKTILTLLCSLILIYSSCGYAARSTIINLGIQTDYETVSRVLHDQEPSDLVIVTHGNRSYLHVPQHEEMLRKIVTEYLCHASNLTSLRMINTPIPPDIATTIFTTILNVLPKLKRLSFTDVSLDTPESLRALANLITNHRNLTTLTLNFRRPPHGDDDLSSSPFASSPFTPDQETAWRDVWTAVSNNRSLRTFCINDIPDHFPIMSFASLRNSTLDTLEINHTTLNSQAISEIIELLEQGNIQIRSLSFDDIRLGYRSAYDSRLLVTSITRLLLCLISPSSPLRNLSLGFRDLSPHETGRIVNNFLTSLNERDLRSQLTPEQRNWLTLMIYASLRGISMDYAMDEISRLLDSNNPIFNQIRLALNAGGSFTRRGETLVGHPTLSDIIILFTATPEDFSQYFSPTSAPASSTVELSGAPSSGASLAAPIIATIPNPATPPAASEHPRPGTSFSCLLL